MTISIYVAGSSDERDRCRAAIELVRELGGTVAHDWPASIDRAGAANDGLDDAARRVAASECRIGLLDCHVVWLLAPARPSAGAWVELGYALALGKRVLISGPASRRTIFAALAEEIPSDITAAHLISEMIKKGSSK